MEVSLFNQPQLFDPQSHQFKLFPWDPLSPSHGTKWCLGTVVFETLKVCVCVRACVSVCVWVYVFNRERKGQCVWAASAANRSQPTQLSCFCTIIKNSTHHFLDCARARVCVSVCVLDRERWTPAEWALKRKTTGALLCAFLAPLKPEWHYHSKGLRSDWRAFDSFLLFCCLMFLLHNVVHRNFRKGKKY